jgi:hypothetical protein
MAIACVGPTVDLSGQGGRWPQHLLDAREPKPRFPRLADWEDAEAPSEAIEVSGGGSFLFEGSGTVSVEDPPPAYVGGQGEFVWTGGGTVAVGIGRVGDRRTAFRWEP